MPLTKKERSLLKSDKAQVYPNDNMYIVKMCLTKGELLALKNSLEHEPTRVGSDVRDYINNALVRAGINLD